MEISDITGIWTFESEVENRLNFIYVAEPNYWFQFIVVAEDEEELRRTPMLYTVSLTQDGRIKASLFGVGEPTLSNISLEDERLILKRDKYRIELSLFTTPTPAWLTELVERSYRKLEARRNA